MANRRDARLLLLDPDPRSRLALHHALRRLGCRVIEEASTGAYALRLLAEEPFDLLITAWGLPDQPALDFLRAVRCELALRALPVVVAARVTPELVAEAAAAGVSGFLPRPFGASTLDTTLGLFLGRRAGAPSHDAAPSFVS